MSLGGAKCLAEKLAIGCVLAIAGTTVLGALLLGGGHDKRAVARTTGTAAPAMAPVIPESSQAASGNVTAKQAGTQPEVPLTPTLSGFVEQNEKLFGVLGVFTAVSIFAGQLTLHWFAYVLSFVFTLLVVILWIELLSKFPSGSGDWRIAAFEELLSLAVIGLVVYVLVDYRQYLAYAIVLLILSLIMGGVSWIIEKRGVFNRVFRAVPRGKTVLAYLIAIAIVWTALYVSFRLTVLIAPAANRVLNAWYKALSQ